LHPHELTAEEKFRLSNLPTTNSPSIAQLQNNLKRTRKLNIIIIVSSILFIFSLIGGLAVLLKKDTTQQQNTEVTPPVQIPTALQPKPVKLQIVLSYDPEPVENQSPKFKFISKQNNMYYENPTSLLPGTYQLVVTLDGYYLKNDDTITIPDKTIYTEKESQQNPIPFELLVQLVAIDRNISPVIIDMKTKTPVTPKEYKINDKNISLQGDTTIKPGIYSLFATFDEYQNIETQVTIAPSKDIFTYEASLQPWKRLSLEIKLPAFKFPKETKLKVYFDEIPINSECINTNIEPKSKIINATVKYSPVQEYKNITLCWGFYSTFYKFDPWSERHTLDDIHGEHLLQYLQQLPSKELRPCLEYLWSEYTKRKKEQENFNAHLAGIDPKIQNKIYEVLKEKTIPEDYKNMESVFWKIRKLYNAGEAKEESEFQNTKELCKNLPFADRKEYWQKLKESNTIYSREIEKIIDYIDKLEQYEKKYFDAVKNLTISSGNKRMLTRAKEDLKKYPYYNQQDLKYIDAEIDAQLKEAGTTLEALWKK
jgi:hypothetical protein